MLSEGRINRIVAVYLAHEARLPRVDVIRRVFAEHGGVGVMILADRVGEPLADIIAQGQLEDRFARWLRRMARRSHRRRRRGNGSHCSGYRQEVRDVARAATQGHVFARATGSGGSHRSNADRRAWDAARIHH